MITPDPHDILPPAPRDPGLEERARALLNAMVHDPESPAFGGRTFDELDPRTRRFAVLAMALVDKTALSEGIGGANVRAFIRCRECRDTGMVRREFKGDPVSWFCMECDPGLRACAEFWRGKAQMPGGQRELKDWGRANPVDAQRVAAVAPAVE